MSATQDRVAAICKANGWTYHVDVDPAQHRCRVRTNRFTTGWQGFENDAQVEDACAKWVALVPEKLKHDR